MLEFDPFDRVNLETMKRLFALIFVFLLSSFQVFSTDIETLKKEVESIRNLKFRMKIKIENVSQNKISEIMKSEIERKFTQNKLENYEAVLKSFYLIPKKSNLKNLVENMMNSQVAGVYDPKEKKMYILQSFSEAEEDEFFDLSQAMNLGDIFIVHELTHAITDQNFNLEKSLNLEDLENEDRQTAGLAVAEGDATLVMMKYIAKTMNLGSEDISNITELMGDVNFYNEFLGETFPRILRETLLFAYTEGLKFINFISKGKDWKKVDNLYRNPPQSTEEIIHPEKYINQNDKPKEVKIEWDELKKDGAVEKLWEGTWGELSTRIILKEWGVEQNRANVSSAGWGGDRYIVYKDRTGETLFIWKTLWDTEKDAKEFEESLSFKKEVSVNRKGNEIVVKKRKEGQRDGKSATKNKLQ